MSIRLRLTLWHAFVIGLLLVGAAIVIYVVLERHLTDQLDRAIEERALAASWAMQSALVERADGNEDSVLDLPKMVADADGSFKVQLVDPSGRLLGRSANLDQPLPIPSSALSQALEGRQSASNLTYFGDRLKIFNMPLLIDGEVMAVLQVAAPLNGLEQDLRRLKLVLALLVVGSTLLASFLGWLLATMALRPVDKIIRGAQAIGESLDFSKLLPVPRQRDELGRLAVTFNRMLEQLAAAFASQRRFLADASHELRTPLTLIQMNAELALRNGEKGEAQRSTALHVIAREAGRMGRLVTDLLTLARADERQRLARHRLALDTLLLEVYEQGRLLAGDVQIELNPFEQVAVDGDPDRLKQLLLNLIDNALRHTRAGGTVTIGVSSEGNWAVLRVADTGPGIQAEERERIFEPFYQGDQGRSGNSGGSGLGLAIARWIAEAHGGRIEVDSEIGAGSAFTIYLPGAFIDPSPPMVDVEQD